MSSTGSSCRREWNYDQDSIGRGQAGATSSPLYQYSRCTMWRKMLHQVLSGIIFRSWGYAP